MSISEYPGVHGTRSDAAVDTDTTGTISGKLRGVVKLLVNLLSRWPASLGQKDMDNSLPVVLPSDQPVNVNVENALIPSASEYGTDSDYTDGDIGGFIVGVRNEALRGFTTADDKYSPLAVDAAGRLFAHVQTTSEADNGLALDGSAGTYVSTPDHADLDITGDIDLRVAVALDSWSPPPNHTNGLLSKRAGSADGYALILNTSGAGTTRIGLAWSEDGTTPKSALATAALPAGTTALLVRATLDVNNGASGHDVKFYTKPFVLATVLTDLTANTGWTQFGSTVTTAGVTSVFSSSGAVEVGRYLGGSEAAGDFYGAVVQNGIAGTVVTNPDFSTQAVGTTSFADTASTPKTWTLAGNAEITGSQTLGLRSESDGALLVSGNRNGVIKDNDGTDATVKVAHLDMTSATTTTIVTGVPNKKIRVLEYCITTQEPTTITDVNFARGSGTTRATGSPLHRITTNSLTVTRAAPPGSFLFETAAGENLRVTQSAAADISVAIVYIETV